MAKKLYRNKKDRVIAGVCSGVGDYFEIDPVIIRIVWLLLIFTGGIGLLAYILAWIIVPARSNSESYSEAEKTKQDSNKDSQVEKEDRSTKLIGGIILIILGILLLFDQEWFLAKFISNIVRIIIDYFVPILLILIGVYFVTRGKEEREDKNNNQENKE